MKEGRMCSGGRVSEERGNGGGRYGGGKPEGQAGEEEKKGGIRGSSTDGRRGSERRSGNFEEFGDGVALLIRRSLDQSHSGNPVLGKQAPSALFHMIPSEPSKRLPVVQEFLKTVMAMQCYKRFNSRTTSQKISEVKTGSFISPTTTGISKQGDVKVCTQQGYLRSWIPLDDLPRVQRKAFVEQALNLHLPIPRGSSLLLDFTVSLRLQ
ncbi:uncharacterized protein LOC143693607 isoform X3 [Agelaius phoeniceus]|uniref:uncharacterized protein LOC143693607 isoform X3 n=1 Tax=Agelaius phoeniceus TaxID=39638 RepID=UPI004054F711